MSRRSADERREHVIEAAIATFAVEGYRGASTTDIARRAGISQPYIYALFRNKQELFLAAYHTVAERIRARLVAAAEAHEDPEARMGAMGEAHLGVIGKSAESCASSRPTPRPATRRSAAPCATSSYACSSRS